MQKERNQYKVFIIGFSLIAIVVVWFALKPFILSWKDRQKKLAEKEANAEILKAPSIIADDLFEKIQNKSKIILVDTSSPDDFKRGHIATAVNTSANSLDKNYFKSIGVDPTAEIVIISQGGDLAILARSVNRIISDGFPSTKYLRGGISDWKEKGYPLVSLGGLENDNAKVKKITIEEIKKDSVANPDLLQFLDVRQKESYSKEHIVGAINIPLSNLERRSNEIPTIKKIIVYGDNENESFQAAVTLFDLNFFNIYQMQGTIEDWKAADGNME